MSTTEDFNKILIEEELVAHRWLRMLVMIGPWITMPIYMLPVYYWLGSSGYLVYFVYVLLAIMVEWSYIRTSFTSAGKVPTNWDPPKGCTYVYPEWETGIIPQYRQCDSCNNGKPPRAAHCKYCGTCTPKMDHHCAWTANCVGEKNHKYFILFLFYTFIFSLMVLTTTILRVFVMAAHSDDDNHPAHLTSGQVMATILGTILATPACIGTLSLMVTQYAAVFRNTTTLEQANCRRLKQYALEVGDHDWTFVHPYDQGDYNNFVSIFGASPILWLLPVSPSGPHHSELIDWPLNKNHREPQRKDSV